MRNKIFDQSGESIFSIVTRWAKNANALDLGQGYPSYGPPEELITELKQISSDNYRSHQYAPSAGLPELRESLSRLYENLYGLSYDVESEITITAGATESVSSALYGLLNEGDTVVVLEPVYDLYVPVARRAGAEVKRISMNNPTFNLPVERLRKRISNQTDLVILNNPHNPTGQVFEPDRLRELVNLCVRHDVYILSDEVYEYLIFSKDKYQPVSSLEGARSRTLMVGSAGKMLDATGWKTGWSLAPEHLTKSLRRAHQFTTYASATPIQSALASYFKKTNITDYLTNFRKKYKNRLQILKEGVDDSLFEPIIPDGTYFLPVRIPEKIGRDLTSSGKKFVKHIIDAYGIAMIPMSSFYSDSQNHNTVFRLAFCKKKKTLKKAVERITDIQL